jgi:hypothetical protein
MEFIQTHMAEVLAAALAVSELLALLPGVKSNGILDLVINVLKSYKPVAK